MLPYTDLPYFILILALAAPALWLGATRRSRSGWLLAAAALMALVHHGARTVPLAGHQAGELGVVCAWTALELGVVWGFARWQRRGAPRFAFALCLAASLAPLALAKLAGVLEVGFAGFAGISYLTFRAVDALIALRDRRVEALDARAFLAYVLFPPTVSAGPIDRFQRFSEDFHARPTRAEFVADLDAGVARVLEGLALKFVLAALVDDFAVSRLASDPRALATFAYMYAYSVYLYFDFAGYSAIAVGVSRFFGVRTPENFDRPYLATDIGDFWSRWHVSLSSWLRDHVYVRVTFGALRRRWFGGNRYAASALAFLATFGLMGAWHGLAPRYLAYGLYHALLSIAHQNLARWVRGRPALASSRAWAWTGRVATLQAVCFGFLIFSGRLGG